MFRIRYSLFLSAVAALCRTRVAFLTLVLTTSVCPMWAQGTPNPAPTLSSASPTQALSGAGASITFSGAGFVPATVVLVNGTAVPTTYQSSTHVVAQITTPVGASGNLAVQVQSPAPGGGSSATLQVPIATLQLTAVDPDGTNTGTAQLGVPVSLTTVNTDTAHTGRGWTLQGAGALSFSGTDNANATYTPPTTMPASPTVTITADLSGLPALATTYTLTLINPAPTVSAANPTQALAGATAAITLTGTGFVAGTTILVNGVAVPTTYSSATSVVAQVPAPAGSSGNLAIQAQNPAPGGGTSATAFQLPTASIQFAATDVDGTNTGTARLGMPVTISAVDTDTAHPVLLWTLQGAGTLTHSGTNYVSAVYTPPTTMPASSTVIITASSAGLAALTNSYTINLINPSLSVTSSTPAQLLTGGTQTVTLTGSGFVSGATVLMNGTALPTTYVSYNQVTVQVPVAANATNALALQLQNPPPSVGPPASYSLPIATTSIALAPTSQTGAVVPLGGSITMAATVSGSMLTAVNWSVSGDGTISSSGIYTAPTAISTGQAVITATLASNPAVTASYPLTFLDPLPTISSASPTQALSGATTSITFTGTGFVPATVVVVNGSPVPTTYQSSTSLSAQITTAAGSSGNLAVQAQSPAPGGGASSTLQLSVATLQVTATDPDGTNTGSAQIGVPVTLSATDTDTASAAVSWKLVGAGSLSSSGTNNLSAVYTPPATMPANPVVTITTYATDLPALTTSYTINLINPALSVTSSKPTQLLTGGTQTVTLTGSGFVPGSTVSSSGTSLPVTYVSSTQVTVQVPVTASANGSLTLQIQNPPPASGSPVSYPLPIAANTIVLAPTTQSGPVVALGSSLTMGATVSGSLSTAVTWSVTGDGAISDSGTYTAPTTLTTGSAVVTAVLTSNPAITASYPLSLVNPVPTVSSASPTQAPAGATASITLAGSGFVPTTVILVNGTSVPTTYVSATSVVAQIAAPAGSTSNLAVLAQNPAPGGGTSAAAFQLPTASLQLTASDPDGTNTGTAQLGIPVNFTTINTDSAYTAVSWKLVGAGSISYSGTNNLNATYTPPATMPASASVTVTAFVTGLPALTTSYTLSLVNPALSVSSAKPAQLLTGGTQTVTLAGAGFVSGTTALLNGAAVPLTYVSPNQATVQVPVAGNATGSLTLQLQNPAPAGGSPLSYALPIAANSISITTANQGGTSVPLGGSLTMTASVNGSMLTTVTWSVTGDGTITSAGVYTAPNTLTTGSAVITATLTSNPTVTATYPVTFLNPQLTLSSANPTQALSGTGASITFAGTGFIPATAILVNGTAVPTTYQSSKAVVAQITTPVGASGNLSVQAQNPMPGGGTSAALQVPIATLQLTAVDPDGTNTGTAQLGVPVSLTTVNTDTAHAGRGWTLQGAGSLSVSGTNNANATYTPPTTMPASPTVTITADLSGLPALATTYTLTLINPAPTVSAANPTQALAGATAAITLTGTGFVAGTTILVNGVAVPTTYSSATSVVAQIPAPAGSSGNLAIQAQNPAPGGGTSATAFQLPTASIQLTATDVDGTNTGTAKLGLPVTISAVDTDTAHPVLLWTLQGAGTLTHSGTNNVSAVYTPPTTMPASSTVVITASPAGLAALTNSYTLNLINPLPTVLSTSPAQLLTGGTQTLALTGTGFVPGVTVLYNGSAIPTTYISSTQASAQVPVPAIMSGNLSLQIQNPAPSGGAPTTFTESVAPNSITLTATGADGINTGYADIDFTVGMSAVINGSVQTAVNWSVVGPGSITSAGVYTPPSTVPANPSATIYAAMASNPAITASYSISIVNPVPTLTGASPVMVAAGSTTTVTLTGTGFVPATAIQVNGVAAPSTYLSPTSMQAQITAASGATGNLLVEAYTSTSNGGASNSYPVAISTPVSITAAARLLDQTTFGPTTSLIQHVQQEGLNSWLAEQYNTPQTVLPAVAATSTPVCFPVHCYESEWWQTVVTGNDQLRQRVAFALGELFVTSSDTIQGWGMPYYSNMLASDAFTNWYQIMTDVTLSPAMGVYLNMLNSAKPSGNLIANENYARENMQLFNLGLDLINQDGSLQLDSNGNPIPAYTEAQVEAFSRVFTGWTYANADGSTPSALNKTSNYNHPLVAVESMHDESPKTLLNGVTLPAGQTAEQDMAEGLLNVFNHPNVPPFVARQLIQHLVKSNPSPAYISRVATVFINDGNGVRGNMQAVLTAIFTDPEARAGDTAAQASDGHLREPILWMTDAMRALGYVNVDPNDYWDNLSASSSVLSEEPFASPSVFNFFSPSYFVPGTTLNAPEFQIENTASIVDRLSLADSIVFGRLAGFNVDLSATSPLGTILVSQGPTALVSALNNLFLYGTMDQSTANAITSEIKSSTSPAQQLRLAVYLTITSSEYKILH